MVSWLLVMNKVRWEIIVPNQRVRPMVPSVGGGGPNLLASGVVPWNKDNEVVELRQSKLTPLPSRGLCVRISWVSGFICEIGDGDKIPKRRRNGHGNVDNGKIFAGRACPSRAQGIKRLPAPAAAQYGLQRCTCKVMKDSRAAVETRGVYVSATWCDGGSAFVRPVHTLGWMRLRGYTMVRSSPGWKHRIFI